MNIMLKDKLVGTNKTKQVDLMECNPRRRMSSKTLNTTPPPPLAMEH
jgi:hypothetical protein